MRDEREQPAKSGRRSHDPNAKQATPASSPAPKVKGEPIARFVLELGDANENGKHDISAQLEVFGRRVGEPFTVDLVDAGVGVAQLSALFGLTKAIRVDEDPFLTRALPELFRIGAQWASETITGSVLDRYDPSHVPAPAPSTITARPRVPGFSIDAGGEHADSLLRTQVDGDAVLPIDSDEEPTT